MPYLVSQWILWLVVAALIGGVVGFLLNRTTKGCQPPTQMPTSTHIRMHMRMHMRTRTRVVRHRLPNRNRRRTTSHNLRHSPARFSGSHVRNTTRWSLNEMNFENCWRHARR